MSTWRCCALNAASRCLAGLSSVPMLSSSFWMSCNSFRNERARLASSSKNCNLFSKASTFTVLSSALSPNKRNSPPMATKAVTIAPIGFAAATTAKVRRAPVNTPTPPAAAVFAVPTATVAVALVPLAKVSASVATVLASCATVVMPRRVRMFFRPSAKPPKNACNPCVMASAP